MKNHDIESGAQIRAMIVDLIRAGANIAIIGPHGIGKTKFIIDACSRLGDDYEARYFSLASASRSDFQIPYPLEDEKGGVYVDYVPHSLFHNRQGRTVKRVLIMDEFNRNVADPQIYNALLELMSVGTMAGKDMHVHSIVALMNPSSDSTYFNTAELEVTSLDRFSAFVPVDGYDLGADAYLARRFPDTATAMIEWYLSLPAEKRRLIPPRRQEHVLFMHERGYDISYAVLPDTQLPLEDLIQIIRGAEYWTLPKILRDPHEAARTLQENPGLLPQFYAVLRSIDSSKVAKMMEPILEVLYPPIKNSLYKEHQRVWHDVLYNIGLKKSEEIKQQGLQI